MGEAEHVVYTDIAKMDHFHILVCGMLFSRYGDLCAGRGLIAGLQSYDPDLRKLSMEMLAWRPSISQQLIRDAIEFGVLLPQDAFPVFHSLATSSAANPPAAQRVENRRHVDEFPIRVTSHR